MIGDRWGVAAAEIARSYPCDEFVPHPTMQAWRGVGIDAPPAEVWPWIVQIRLAPYSYDWIDNLGRRSPQELRGLADPRPGDPFTTAAAGELGTVLSVDHQEQLTARIAGAVMSYVLVPEGIQTRLLLKIVTSQWRVLAPLVSLGDLIMARRQLMNFKRLAEADSRRSG